MHSGISYLSEGEKDGGKAVGILDYLPGNYCHHARAVGMWRVGSMGTMRPLTFLRLEEWQCTVLPNNLNSFLRTIVRKRSSDLNNVTMAQFLQVC